MHTSYSLPPARSEPSDDISTDSRDLSFPQPSDTYNTWGSLYPPPNLPPNATFGVPPPTFHHSTLSPTPYSNFPCQPSSWSTGNIEARSEDEYMPAPSYYHPPTPSLHNSGASLHHHVDYALEPYSGTLGASYPCLWTEGGITCNVMVLATRSHVNRHLHARHEFGGSDTRQTRCHWAGCGEIMQQGSIARHVVTCHLQAKVTCPMCSKKLSRQDVISKHQRVCPAASAWR